MASSSLGLASRFYNIPPLMTNNYASWSIKLELFLIRSQIWIVVDGSDEALDASDVKGLATWNLRNSKAHSDIFLHCSEKQLISLRSLPTSKHVWDRLKQLNEKSNKALQVNLHKQLCRLTMSNSNDVMTFMESW